MLNAPRFDQEARPSFVARAFGLDGAAEALVAALFAESLQAAGFDGATAVARLDAGEPPSRALGVPDRALSAIHARAHRWFAVGHIEKAEDLFRALCFLDPDNRESAAGYAICLKERGFPEAAEAAFEFVRARHPDWATPYLHLAEIALSRRARDVAARMLDAFETRVADDGATTLLQRSRALRAAIDGP